MNSQTNILALKLGGYLSRFGLKITTAESCTGGGLSAAITAVPGSSAWFDAAFITYSNPMKNKILSVPLELMEVEGAVSEGVALEMLRGAIANSGSDLGVAITGIAGPSGATDTKPVGTVCIAYGGLDSEIKTKSEQFKGDRQSVREQSVIRALQLILEYCQKKA